MKESKSGDQLKEQLFNFYTDRLNGVESFRTFNNILGLTASCLSGYVIGLVDKPIGAGLAIVAVGTTIVNSVRLSKLADKTVREYREIVGSVYDSQKK